MPTWVEMHREQVAAVDQAAVNQAAVDQAVAVEMAVKIGA